ncbi:MAG: hypothetical protein AVDCRST_MAG52-2220, partial [uncultured Blastococcus sp.]
IRDDDRPHRRPRLHRRPVPHRRAATDPHGAVRRPRQPRTGRRPDPV